MMNKESINIFEVNDFSNMKIIDFEDSKIFYMDNFYKYPELVFEFFNSKEPPIWKEWENPSRNMIDFEDRRHQFYDDRLSFIYKQLSFLCGQEPLNDNLFVSNYTRFKKCSNNDYIKNYWWPHHDSGYNAIVYFNNFDDQEYEGTNIYSPIDKEYIDSHQKPEHEDPWTLKDKWEITIKIKAKYNRFVMFEGSKYWHGMSLFDDRWFGDDYKDANFRINQVLFFNNESRT